MSSDFGEEELSESTDQLDERVSAKRLRFVNGGSIEYQMMMAGVREGPRTAVDIGRLPYQFAKDIFYSPGGVQRQAGYFQPLRMDVLFIQTSVDARASK